MTYSIESKTSLHYVSEGEGSPVILVHGMAASLHDWDHLMPELAQRAYRAYALDLLGHGESPRPNGFDGYHYHSLYSHLCDWIAGLELDQPPVLIGHSLGGCLSLQYALDHQERVKALVLADPYYRQEQLSPWLRLVNRRPAVAEIALRLAPAWLIHASMGFDPRIIFGLSPGARRQIAEDYKRASPKIIHIPPTIPDMSAQLSSIEQSTLVVWGEDDLTLSPDSFPKLVRSLPHARGHAIPHCGHQPHIVFSNLFSRLVLDFLDDLENNQS